MESSDPIDGGGWRKERLHEIAITALCFLMFVFIGVPAVFALVWNVIQIYGAR